MHETAEITAKNMCLFSVLFYILPISFLINLNYNILFYVPSYSNYKIWKISSPLFRLLFPPNSKLYSRLTLRSAVNLKVLLKQMIAQELSCLTGRAPVS